MKTKFAVVVLILTLVFGISVMFGEGDQEGDDPTYTEFPPVPGGDDEVTGVVSETKQFISSGHSISIPSRVDIQNSNFLVKKSITDVPESYKNAKLIGDPGNQAVLFEAIGIRLLFDLDFYVDANGEKKAIQEYQPPINRVRPETEVRVNIAFNKDDMELIAKKREILLTDNDPDNDNARPIYLLFWTKPAGGPPERGYWEIDNELIRNGEIYDVELHEWGFSFKIYKWPADDRPVAIGG